MEKKITVKKVGSLIRQPAYQGRIVRGLGLRKTNSVRVLADTPSVRGMIDKVSHLVKIIETKN
jgi:large subunit ribosomal protein L30